MVCNQVFTKENVKKLIELRKSTFMTVFDLYDNGNELLSDVVRIVELGFEFRLVETLSINEFKEKVLMECDYTIEYYNDYCKYNDKTNKLEVTLAYDEIEEMDIELLEE